MCQSQIEVKGTDGETTDVGSTSWSLWSVGRDIKPVVSHMTVRRRRNKEKKVVLAQRGDTLGLEGLGSLDQRQPGQKTGRVGSRWGWWGGLSKDLVFYSSLKGT